jgi:hypothetical protein
MLLLYLASHERLGPNRGFYVPTRPENPMFRELQSDITRIGTNELRRINNEITPANRYDGKSFPIKHIETYCKQCAPMRYDDFTFILFFQATLTGTALKSTIKGFKGKEF